MKKMGWAEPGRLWNRLEVWMLYQEVLKDLPVSPVFWPSPLRPTAAQPTWSQVGELLPGLEKFLHGQSQNEHFSCWARTSWV